MNDTGSGQELGTNKTASLRHDKKTQVLVTGATGFIGTRLIPALAESGYSVRGMSRRDIPDTDNVKYVQTDAFDPESLRHAMQGIDVAYYLLHSMEGDKKTWQDFASREIVQAQNFLKAASEEGVGRIIYLGGLVHGSTHLSLHMQSRGDVGEMLASGQIPVTELRASIIIGAQGSSYQMLRYLVERLPVMVCPSWVKSLAQPIDVRDVIKYLTGCLSTQETKGRILEIGGPEKITYEEMMRAYSAYLGRSLRILQIPFLTTRLSSYWVDLVTPVKASLARPLIDSLVHDTVVEDDSIIGMVPLKLHSVEDAIRTAERESKNETRQDASRRTGFGANHVVIQLALVAMALVGTTYYWQDARPDVYLPVWLALSALWYAGIVFSIVAMRGRTRLGYLVDGMLAWVTMAFWLLDNSHLLFQASILASPPDPYTAVRNFIGAGVAALAVAASHNLFHKVAYGRQNASAASGGVVAAEPHGILLQPRKTQHACQPAAIPSVSSANGRTARARARSCHGSL